MNYTDSSLIAAAIKRELTSNEQLTLSVLLPAIDTYINNRCDTTFLEATSATQRFYDGGEATIDIEPCTSITEIAEIDNYGVTTYIYNQNNYNEVIKEPQNETVKTELRKRYGCFPHGTGRIAVTANFSSYNAGVPEDITQVATMLAVEALRIGQVGTDNVARENLEGHDVIYNTPDVTVANLGDANPFIKSVFEQHRDLQIG